MELISPRRSPRPDSSARIWTLKNSSPHGNLFSRVVWLYPPGCQRRCSARRPREKGHQEQDGHRVDLGQAPQPRLGESEQVLSQNRSLSRPRQRVDDSKNTKQSALGPAPSSGPRGKGGKHGTTVSALLSGWQGGCQEKHDKFVSIQRRRCYDLGDPPLLNSSTGHSEFLVKHVSVSSWW